MNALKCCLRITKKLFRCTSLLMQTEADNYVGFLYFLNHSIKTFLKPCCMFPSCHAEDGWQKGEMTFILHGVFALVPAFVRFLSCSAHGSKDQCARGLLPLRKTPTQPNEPQHPWCNCHLFWSRMMVSKQRLSWQRASYSLDGWMDGVGLSEGHLERHMCVIGRDDVFICTCCVTSEQIHG